MINLNNWATHTKRHTLIILLLLFSVSVFGQESQKIFYLKNNGQKVISEDKADFIRIIKPSDTSDGYEMIEVYKNDSLKRRASISKYEPNIILNGMVKDYAKSGALASEFFYVDNKPVGRARYFYANGAVKKIIQFIPKDITLEVKDISSWPKQKLVSFYDSLGKQLVVDGNGFSVDKDGEVIERGKWLDGVKDSIWTGENAAKDFSYSEFYSGGKLLSGTSVKHGTKYTYNELEQQPVYPGGLEAFYNFIGRSYKYPKEALKEKVSGRILLTFVVEKDGSITDIKVLRDLGFGTGEEAEKVLSWSKKWIPGRQRGVPVRVSYTIPILLNASRI